MKKEKKTGGEGGIFQKGTSKPSCEQTPIRNVHQSDLRSTSIYLTPAIISQSLGCVLEHAVRTRQTPGLPPTVFSLSGKTKN